LSSATFYGKHVSDPWGFSWPMAPLRETPPSDGLSPELHMHLASKAKIGEVHGQL